jgi:hypothetical protein
VAALDHRLDFGLPILLGDEGDGTAQIRNGCGFKFFRVYRQPHVQLGSALRDVTIVAQPLQPLAMLNLRLGFEQQATGVYSVL